MSTLNTFTFSHSPEKRSVNLYTVLFFGGGGGGGLKFCACIKRIF